MDNVRITKTTVPPPVDTSDLFFSIIMPCYNSEAYVRNALQSIVGQTYSNWELIAINDGSTDATLSILDSYAAQDPRIRVYSKPNGGYVSAVNYGLEKITGDYFLFLGSDDRLSETLFQDLMDSAGTMNADCIAFRTVKVYSDNSQEPDPLTNIQNRTSMGNTTFAGFTSAYPQESAILSCRDTSKCYKRALLGDLRYFGKYGMDADGIFSMLFCHQAASFLSVPVDGYFWTLRGDSLSGRQTFFVQECDRVNNWVLFYNRLLQLDSLHITSTEQGYLYIFVEILESLWKNHKPSAELYRCVKEAAQIILQVAEKINYDLKDALSGERWLLLRSPLLWKLYSCTPQSLRNLAVTVKKLLKKNR